MPTQNDANSSVGHVSSVAPSPFKTPEPWHVGANTSRGWIIADSQSRIIGFVTDTAPDGTAESAFALERAWLVAAAPVMLQTLSELLAALSRMSQGEASIDVVQGACDALACKAAAAIAISKAERGQ